MDRPISTTGSNGGAKNGGNVLIIAVTDDINGGNVDIPAINTRGTGGTNGGVTIIAGGSGFRICDSSRGLSVRPVALIHLSVFLSLTLNRPVKQFLTRPVRLCPTASRAGVVGNGGVTEAKAAI